MKRKKCRMILAATAARNGSNIKNGKHRRAALKRRGR